jgi:hypothetical protein
LFADFKAAEGSAKKASAGREDLRRAQGHTVIEEEIFYPASRGKVEDGLLNEGYVEHDVASIRMSGPRPIEFWRSGSGARFQLAARPTLFSSWRRALVFHNPMP